MFVPKKPLFTRMKLSSGVSYICRLNNHMTYDEIVNHTKFLKSSKICPNSFVINTKIKNPSITAKDIHDKIVYDIVRRNTKSRNEDTPRRMSKKGLK